MSYYPGPTGDESAQEGYMNPYQDAYQDGNPYNPWERTQSYQNHHEYFIPPPQFPPSLSESESKSPDSLNGSSSSEMPSPPSYEQLRNYQHEMRAVLPTDPSGMPYYETSPSSWGQEGNNIIPNPQSSFQQYNYLQHFYNPSEHAYQPPEQQLNDQLKQEPGAYSGLISVDFQPFQIRIPPNMSSGDSHNNPPPNVGHERQQKKKTSPSDVKSYYAIQNKRPAPKMKASRKKRANPETPIPYVTKGAEDRFLCTFQECGFTANRRSNITRHMEAMHESHYIICCHILFPTKTHFEVHRLNTHPNGRFQCKISGCTRFFNRKALLHHHEARCHSEDYVPFPVCCVCSTTLPKPDKAPDIIKAHSKLHAVS